jgi:hypothetical protein
MDERSLDEAIIQTAQAEAVAPVALQAKRAERNSSRGLKAAVAISIIGLFLSFLWNGYNTREIAQNEAQYVITQQGLDSLAEANEKLRERGLPEIPVPREGDGLDADALAAAAAAILKDDIYQDPSFKGRSGDRGEPCTPQVPGCTGQPGKSGSEGARGQDGANGLNATDEQVGEAVEAYCSRPTNPCVGPQGLAGEPGPMGPEGPAGQLGPEGPFCPEGFEARKKIVVTDDNAFDLLLVCDEL